MMSERESLQFEVQSGNGILYDVKRGRNRTLTATIRVCGRVTINHREYCYDRDVKIKLPRASLDKEYGIC